MAQSANGVSAALSGVYEVPVTKLQDTSVRVSVATMKPETIAAIFGHGLKQLVNDATSGEKDKAKVLKAAEAMAQRLGSNEWSPGAGGGPRLSPFERAMRSCAASALQKHCGRKAVDAAKDAAKLEQAATSVVLTLDAKANGGEAKLQGDALIAAVKERLQMWQTSARTIVETEATLQV